MCVSSHTLLGFDFLHGFIHDDIQNRIEVPMRDVTQRVPSIVALHGGVNPFLQFWAEFEQFGSWTSV